MNGYECKVVVKGNITRPSYDGDFTLKSSVPLDWHKIRECIAKTLRETSFPDGCSTSDITLLEVKEI
jgi:hypothetical protein